MIAQIFKLVFMIVVTTWHWVVYFIKYLWRLIA